MKEKNSDKSKKYMSMSKIVIISLLIASAITLIYFVIEGICVYTTGKMPYTRVLWGGDCAEYAGIFWHILELYPMTSMDDPAPSDTIQISFSVMMIFASILFLFIFFWTILCLINRKFKPVIIAYTLAALSFLIIVLTRRSMTSWKDTPVELAYIRIYTTDLRPNEYVTVDYPGSALKFIKAGEDGKYGRLEKDYITQGINPADVSKEQLNRLLKAAEKVKNNSRTDIQDGYTFYVSIIYKTRDGYDSLKFYGYGGYPEGWNDLVSITNEICGDEYLRENPETAVLTPEWFTENFGITDDDLPDGMTVAEYLDSKKITMKTFSGLTSSGTTFDFDAARIAAEYATPSEPDTTGVTESDSIESYPDNPLYNLISELIIYENIDGFSEKEMDYSVVSHLGEKFEDAPITLSDGSSVIVYSRMPVTDLESFYKDVMGTEKTFPDGYESDSNEVGIICSTDGYAYAYNGIGWGIYPELKDVTESDDAVEISADVMNDYSGIKEGSLSYTLIPSDNAYGYTLDTDSIQFKDIYDQYSLFDDAELCKLTKDDFTLTYLNITFGLNNTWHDYVRVLGYPKDYEENNRGYISSDNGFWWHMRYPSLQDDDYMFDIVMVSPSLQRESNDSYIDHITLKETPTKRGVKAGDSVAKLVTDYGKPSMIAMNINNDDWKEIIYENENGRITFVIDNDNIIQHVIFSDF